MGISPNLIRQQGLLLHGYAHTRKRAVQLAAEVEMLNLAVVTGLAPTKGIALPLVSSGGTGWVLTAFSVGLVVALSRQRTQPAMVPLRKRAQATPMGVLREG